VGLDARAPRSPTIERGVTHTQTPLVHARPPPQLLPQRPQLCGSLETSTHAPPQSINPVGHTHALFTHATPAGHV
jgi:hypothetical protein